jgi:hypothetical protein
MLGRVSRSSSQNSLNANEDYPLQNGSRQENIQAQNEQQNTTDQDPLLLECVQFTKNHPIGSILIKLAQDNTALAKKTNLKGVETNITDLCSSFHIAMQNEKANMEDKFSKTHRDIEDAIVFKEINSHKLNSAIHPPTYFSPIPTLDGANRLTEVHRLFPRNIKFSGQKQDNNISVTEFLNTMKASQALAKLSEEEFIDRMLSCSTGTAHELIQEWRNNGENVNTIYHNLLINFDKRISPEEAKQQLLAYKVPKTCTLAKAESNIMLLASRAASQMPEGISRTNYYNMEACNTIIRALPPVSSASVNNLYNQISARLGRAATFAELSKAMNLYRVTIDRDIKNNGTDSYFKGRRTQDSNFKGHTGTTRQKFTTTFSLNATQDKRPFEKKHFSGHKGAYNNTVSFTPKPQQVARPNTRFANHFTQNNQYKKWDPRQKFNNFNRGRNNNRIIIDSCSTCGLKSHKTTDCTNLVSDSGKQIRMLPTQGVCSRCPRKISPRLHHPEALCPYRTGGPLNNRQVN